MAMTVAWAKPPGDVAIQFAHNPAIPSAGTLVGERLYVNPDFIQRIGWTFAAGRGQMTVNGEGRNLRLPTKEIQGRPCIDILEAARLIGGKAEWSPDRKLVAIHGVVRSVEATDSTVRIDTTIGAKATAFRISDPPRLVVDITGVEVDLERLQPLPPNHRIGQFNANTVRYVIESPEMARLKVPTFTKGRTILFSLTQFEAKPAKAAPSPSSEPIQIRAVSLSDDGTAQAKLMVGFEGASGQRPSARYEGPTRIVLTLPSAVAPAGLEVRDSSSIVKSAEIRLNGPTSVSVVLETVRPLSFTVGQQGEVAYLKLRAPLFGGLAGRLIVVDAGHGGHDSGAKGGGTLEKANALDTAKRLAAELAEAGASVILTRDDDTFVTLNERPAVANRAGADLFISCHFNSNTVANSRSGTIIFYHKDDPEGKLLAECVRSVVAKRSDLPDLGTWSDQRIYQSGFAVLRGAEMPGVLLELGFINHATDRSKITDPAWRQAMAESVVEALRIYFSNGQ